MPTRQPARNLFLPRIGQTAMSAERLRELAAAVRAGENIDWERERDAMALEITAAGQEWSEDVIREWNAENDYLGSDPPVPPHVLELLQVSQ